MKKLLLLFLLSTLNLFADIQLKPSDASIQGPKGNGQLAVSRGVFQFWHSIDSTPIWNLNFAQAGKFEVIALIANEGESGSKFEVNCAGQKLQGIVPDSGKWQKYVPVKLGLLQVAAAGEQQLQIKALTRPGRAVMNLKAIVLKGKGKVSVVRPFNAFGDKAGFGSKLRGAHPGVTITDLTPERLAKEVTTGIRFDIKKTFKAKYGLRVTGIDFFKDGRMALCTWDGLGSVFIIENYSGKAQDLRIKRFATGLSEPLGLKVVDEEIYVCQKQELTKLVDSDKDGRCDQFICVSNAWDVSSNFHEFTFGPVYKNGFFYIALAIAVNPGGATTNPQQKDRGCLVKIDPKNGKYSVVAAGLRTPNGVCLSPDGDIFVADNQGDWLPASKIVHIKQDRFFSNKYFPRHSFSTRKATNPVVWMPQNEIGNSPSEPTFVPQGIYRGQMLFGDVHHGGIKRASLDKVNGEFQGAVYRFCNNLRGGVNRLCFDSKGALYAGMVGSRGNWGNKKWDGLLRLNFDKKKAFEMLSIRAMNKGIEITFTEPLAAAQGWDANFYKLDSWRYVPTVKYGGPKVDKYDLKPSKISVSADRRKVYLELPQMKAGFLIHLLLNKELKSETGQAIFAGETWYNLNSIPTDRPASINTAPQNIVVARIGESIKLSRGHELYKSLCISCHRTDAQKLVGPGFGKLFGRHNTLIDGRKVKVDEAYIRRSILKPTADVPVGFQPIMPVFDTLSKADIDALLKFIKKQK